MAVSLPIAVNRIATFGSVADQAIVTGMGNDTLRLSFVSSQATPGHGLWSGALSDCARIPHTLRGIPTATTALRQRPTDRDADAWRGDGRMLPARYRVNMLNVMPSQENPKSKAFASA